MDYNHIIITNCIVKGEITQIKDMEQFFSTDKYIYIISKEKLQDQIGIIFRQESSLEFINFILSPKDTKRILEVYVSKIAVCHILGDSCDSSHWQVVLYNFNTQEMIKELNVFFENRTKLYDSKSNSYDLLLHNKGAYIDKNI